MRMGHGAMIRPVVGRDIVLREERISAGSGAKGESCLANSDLSGISIFEEAQFRHGVECTKLRCATFAGR